MAVADFPLYDAIEAAARIEWLRGLGYDTGASIIAGLLDLAPGAPAGTVIGTLTTSIPGATITIVSGPFALSAQGQISTTSVTGEAGTSQTMRVKAERASPFLSLTQDIVITATGDVAVENPPAGFAFVLSPVTGDELASPVTGLKLIKEI